MEKMPVGTMLLYALGGAAIGTLGTIVIQRLLPPPAAGDGFSVRWLDPMAGEKRIDFGEDEKSALERAIGMVQVGKYAAVEVIEIRSGRVVRIQQAGKPVQEVPT